MADPDKPDSPEARRPLPDAVAARLRAAITSGEFKPGDRLPPERELAERLKVNRSSVREALKKLQQLRLIDIQQGSGIRVRALEDASFDLVWDMVTTGEGLDRTWLKGLLELREAIFPGILRLAMERSTAAQRAEIATEIQGLNTAAVSDDEFIDRLRQVQASLTALTQNPVMTLLSNALLRVMRRPHAGIVADWVAADRRRLTPILHRFGIAFAANDLETAERAIRDLARRISDVILEGMDGVLAQKAAS